MTKSKAHEAALKLVNEIALVDTEMAAKIKPSIDMFVESLESTLTNTQLYNDLAEFFKLTDDNAKRQWLDQHKELAQKIDEIFDSMKNAPQPLNEVKELKDGDNKDVPIEPDGKKKKAKEDEEEEDNNSTEVPEDKFDGETITAPLKIDGDDQRFMGKDKKPTEKEMDPNNTPKVIDGNGEVSGEVKNPDLSKMKTAMESVRKIYRQSLNENVEKIVKKSNIIGEATAKDYTEFLDQFAFDDALTSVENDPQGYTRKSTRFTPIRKYATALRRKFPKDFVGYDTAMKVAQNWYNYNGRRKYQQRKGIKSDVYVEMRGAADGFDINLFLSKLNDNPEEGPMPLTGTDEEFIADVNDTFTGEYSGEKGGKFWQKIDGITEGGHELWKATIHFPKSRPLDFPVRQLKFKIVEFINTSYKDNYHATSTIPPWLGEFMYNSQTGATTESLNEDKEAFDKNNVQDLAQEFVEDILSMGDNPNDMTVYDFMDWAWDGKVPEADQKYVSTMFNYAKKNATKVESLNEDIEGISKEAIKSIVKSLIDDFMDDYSIELGNENVSTYDIESDILNSKDEAYEYVLDNFNGLWKEYCGTDEDYEDSLDAITEDDIKNAFDECISEILEDV